jgi:hypothetical protein
MTRVMVAGLLALAVAGGVSADDNPGAKPGAGKAGKGNGQMLLRLLERADTNKDGKISLEEFKKFAASLPGGKLKEHADQVFKRLDSNGDGYITKDEIKKAMEQMAARRAEGGKGKKPGEEAFDVQPDGRANSLREFVARAPSRDAPRQIGHVCSQIRSRIFDNDCVSLHVVVTPNRPIGNSFALR